MNSHASQTKPSTGSARLGASQLHSQWLCHQRSMFLCEAHPLLPTNVSTLLGRQRQSQRVPQRRLTGRTGFCPRHQGASGGSLMVQRRADWNKTGRKQNHDMHASGQRFVARRQRAPAGERSPLKARKTDKPARPASNTTDRFVAIPLQVQ